MIDHDGTVYDYGDPAAEPIVVRFTDKGAALHVAKDPRMGAGEAYMDGRMVGGTAARHPASSCS